MSVSIDGAAQGTAEGGLTAARTRIITAALELFGRHGVGGTSLQMIADEIGVTKAAVYHQYRTKELIILAVAESELARLEAVIDAAEAEPTPKRARDALVSGIVDLSIERGPKVSTMLRDPVVGRLFANHEGFRDAMRRQQRLLVGEAAGPEAHVRIAVLLAAVGGAPTHPFVADFDKGVLRSELVRLAGRVLVPPG